MREWPVLSIGIAVAALCCVLTPIVLAFLGVASLRAVAGDLFPPLLVGVVGLAALALGLTAVARRRRSANEHSPKKA